ADAAVKVAHETAALAVAAQPGDQAAVGRVEPDQLKRTPRLRIGLLPEDQVSADEVREVAKILQALCRQQDRRVVRATQPNKSIDERAALSAREEKPRLIEQDDLVAGAIAGDEPQRVGGDERERGDADALRACVRLSARARVGQRQAGRANRRDRRRRAGGGVRAAVAEAEPREPEVGEHVERVGRLLRGRGIARAQPLDHGERRPLARAYGVAHRALNRVLPRRRRLAQQVEVVRAGQLLAQILQPDCERIERAAMLLGAGQLQYVDAPGELRNAVQSVIGLRVEVDHPRPAPLRRERDQLGGIRLAAPERAREQDRRRARLPARGGRVVLDRSPAGATGDADVDAALGADALGAERHKRAELLDGQLRRVVADRAAVRTRQMIEIQRLLEPSRTMERQLAELVAQRRDAALQLDFLRRADREPERAEQHRRVARALEDRLVLACEYAILLGEQAHAANVTFDLVAVDLLDIGNSAADLRERLTISDPAEVPNCIDREKQRLQRREQELRGRAGEFGCVGERAETQLRLMRVATLSLDEQPGCAAARLADGRVAAAPKV